MVDLTLFAKDLDLLYRDKLWVKRYSEVQNDDGTTDIVQSDECDSKEILCHATQVKEDEQNKSVLNEVNGEYKLFLSPYVEIKKGDKLLIQIERAGRVLRIKGEANQPVVYDISQEVGMLVEEVL